MKTKIKLINKITRKKNPYKNKIIEESHRVADTAEKKKYPKGYKKLKKFDNKLGKHEFAGENTYSGKVEVSKKVPKKLRKEVEFHEKVELKNKLKRKK